MTWILACFCSAIPRLKVLLGDVVTDAKGAIRKKRVCAIFPY